MKMIMKPAFLKTLIASITVVCLSGLVTPADAADWLQYRGNLGNGKTTESVGSETAGAIKLSIDWTVPTPLGFSSFSIAGGRAFTLVSTESDGGELQEHCIAVDVASGNQLWSTGLGSGKYEQGGGNAGARDNRGGDGPRSTPSTDGKLVFVYDSHMVLTCLNANDGSQVWQHDIVAEHAGQNIKWLNATSPLMIGEHLFVAGGGPGETFLAFKKANGELVWKSGDDKMTHATPTAAEINGKQQLVFFMQSGLVGIDRATGKQLWNCEFPFSTSTAASAVVDGNKVYCSAGYGVGAGLFEVGSSTEADEVWFKSNELMNHWSTPVVHNGHLYGIFEFKKYGKAPLQCVELATGEIKWSEYGFGPGNCVLADGKLVVLSDAGEVSIVAADPTKYVQLARIKAVAGKCWSTPAIADGKAYVRSTVEAARIDLGN